MVSSWCAHHTPGGCLTDRRAHHTFGCGALARDRGFGRDHLGSCHGHIGYQKHAQRDDCGCKNLLVVHWSNLLSKLFYLCL